VDAPPVPSTFDDITLAWCNAAIRHGGVLDADFASVAVEPMDPSKGLIGDLANVHLTYARGSGPSELVLKLPAQSPDSRKIGDMLGAYAREVAFYREVATRSEGTRLAKCYYSGADEKAGRWALLLESIPADEFDFFGGATSAQANAAVDALADFHQRWWNASEPLPWMPGFDKSGVGGLQPMWLANLPHFVDRYRPSLPGNTDEWVLRFAHQLTDWCQRAALEPLTMVHSDYRIDNLLFQGDQVTIIDWQTAMRAPPAMDLASFIATSLSIADRRDNEAVLIDRYLDRLAARGTTVDRTWFLRSYDENVLWWMGQFGNNLAFLTPRNEAVQHGLTTMVERVFTTAVDRNVSRLL